MYCRKTLAGPKSEPYLGSESEQLAATVPGGSSIQTAIWIMKGPSFCCSNAGFTFPVTDQEAANLRAYAQDVASVVSASGNRLHLFVALNWLHEADYTIGSPTTTLGPDNLTPAEYVSRVQATTNQILAAVGDVTRPDGVKLVDTIFFDAEANLPDSQTPPGPITNTGWFLVTNYPYFVSGASQVGIRPAVYFSCVGDQADVFDDTYVDALFPILNGHRSMFQVYRGLKFFVENGLPIPLRPRGFRLLYDFDRSYIQSTAATHFGRRRCDLALARRAEGLRHSRNVLSSRPVSPPPIWTSICHTSNTKLAPSARQLLDLARRRRAWSKPDLSIHHRGFPTGSWTVTSRRLR